MLKKKFLTTSSLKIIAITVMFIDHFAASGVYGLLSGSYYSPVYYNDPMYLILRTIGRLAFPIFTFLIAEGFYHTHNKYRYLLRLSIFVFISELPFDLAFNTRLPITSFSSIINFSYQNVFFTLALGLLAVMVFDLLKNKKEVSKRTHIVLMITGYISVFAICYAAKVMKTDYSFPGVLLIFSYYYFRGNFLGISISTVVINILMVYPALYNSFLGHHVPFISYVEMFSILSLVFIYFYNNEKGLKLKYLFYWFYPVHLFLLFCVKYMLLAK